MKKVTDPRHLSREIALQRLFAQDFNRRNINPNISEFNSDELAGLDEIEGYKLELVETIVKGVNERKEDIEY